MAKKTGDDSPPDAGSQFPKLDSWETLLFSTAPHSKSFVRLWAGYGLLTALWIAFLVVSAFNVSTSDRAFWWGFIFVGVVIASAVYAQCRGMLGKNRTMIYICNFWAIALIVTVCILLMKLIHTEVALTKKEWWEGYLGLPFSISSIMLFLLVFIISRVVWRVAYLTPKPYSFPLYAASICLIIVSLYSLSLAREFDLLSAPETLQYLFLIFALITILFSFFLVSFINHKGGITYKMTTRRIVVSSEFLKHSVEDHMFDKIHDVELEQSYLGRKYNYGDVNIRIITVLETRKGEKLHRHTFAMHGVPAPMLMKNTLMAIVASDLAMRKPPAPNAVESSVPSPRAAIPQIIVTQEYMTAPADEPAQPVAGTRAGVTPAASAMVNAFDGDAHSIPESASAGTANNRDDMKIRAPSRIPAGQKAGVKTATPSGIGSSAKTARPKPRQDGGMAKPAVRATPSPGTAGKESTQAKPRSKTDDWNPDGIARDYELQAKKKKKE
jgi:bacteriorhodopsin